MSVAISCQDSNRSIDIERNSTLQVQYQQSGQVQMVNIHHDISTATNVQQNILPVCQTTLASQREKVACTVTICRLSLNAALSNARNPDTPKVR